MPREPKELIREGGFKDAEKFYILSFEGTVSEKRYFKDFRIYLITMEKLKPFHLTQVAENKIKLLNKV